MTVSFKMSDIDGAHQSFMKLLLSLACLGFNRSTSDRRANTPAADWYFWIVAIREDKILQKGVSKDVSRLFMLRNKLELSCTSSPHKLSVQMHYGGTIIMIRGRSVARDSEMKL